jgi:hypothetical protein
MALARLEMLKARIRVLLAPEVAIDLALRLTGAVNAVRSAAR